MKDALQPVIAGVAVVEICSENPGKIRRQAVMRETGNNLQRPSLRVAGRQLLPASAIGGTALKEFRVTANQYPNNSVATLL
jgi:hypothetical protein